MFDRIVVGVDDYEAGRDAVELARRLISADGKLMLVYVQVALLVPDAGSRDIDRRRALERLGPVREDAHVDAELMLCFARSVAAGLHDAVRRHGDLLVIGASRRDEYQRVFIGDDARDVLEHPPSPVAVAPAGYAMPAPALRRIGVAYDGSPGAEQALAMAREVARERHGELSAFDAVPEPLRIHDVWSPETEIEEGVARAREWVAALGDVEPHAASGDPAEVLGRYAASVDLLVVGPHEHRRIDDLRGGSTSQGLAGGTPCPLLVLPSPTGGRAGSEGQLTETV